MSPYQPPPPDEKKPTFIRLWSVGVSMSFQDERRCYEIDVLVLAEEELDAGIKATEWMRDKEPWRNYPEFAGKKPHSSTYHKPRQVREFRALALGIRPFYWEIDKWRQSIFGVDYS